MRVWRLTHPKWKEAAFTGEGSRIAGRRWNPPGWAAVYCADSLALAMLEVLVHLAAESRDLIFLAYPVQVPDEAILTLPASELPKHWRQEPAPENTQSLGERWLRRGETLALQVPSVIVPQETNLIINPNHQDFGQVVVGPAEEVGFDSRIWQG
ncbi:RES family NAD+ phosphorylase [Thiohalorhabdus methylotrophus]|uniref:RES family NAD+ phosphorylase n=1 Tax=Thiohalorhabdus methylotrophus TaxID=3242694 RepID=A0ABV4TUK0_9GAMM